MHQRIEQELKLQYCHFLTALLYCKVRLVALHTNIQWHCHTWPLFVNTKSMRVMEHSGTGRIICEWWLIWLVELRRPVVCVKNTGHSCENMPARDRILPDKWRRVFIIATTRTRSHSPAPAHQNQPPAPTSTTTSSQTQTRGDHFRQTSAQVGNPVSSTRQTSQIQTRGSFSKTNTVAN